MVMTRTMVMAAMAVMAVAGTASAQTFEKWADRVYVNVNLASQPKSQEYQEGKSFDLYDEQGSFTVPYRIRTGGFGEVNGGVRVWRNLAVGIGFSRIPDAQNVQVSARVPHPLVYDQHRTTASTASGLAHSQRAVYLQAVWMMPFRNAPIPYFEKLDVALSIGPAFFTVKQDYVSNVSVAEVGRPYTSVDIASVTKSTREASRAGVSFGVDISRPLYERPRARVGAGIFLRYAGASAELALAGGTTTTIKVGGFQAGGGLRVQFK